MVHHAVLAHWKNLSKAIREVKLKLEVQLGEFSDKNAGLSDQIALLNDEIAALKQQNSDLNVNLDQEKQSNAELLEKIKQLEDEIARLNGLLKEAEGWASKSLTKTRLIIRLVSFSA